jgi:hypothetical protein
MNISNHPEIKHTPSLADLLTEEQEAQLAVLLAEIMLHGWGTLEIEIRKGKVRFFRPKPSIRLKMASKSID